MGEIGTTPAKCSGGHGSILLRGVACGHTVAQHVLDLFTQLCFLLIGGFPVFFSEDDQAKGGVVVDVV